MRVGVRVRVKAKHVEIIATCSGIGSTRRACTLLEIPRLRAAATPFIAQGPYRAPISTTTKLSPGVADAAASSMSCHSKYSSSMSNLWR